MNGERGSVTLFIVLLATAILGLGGVVNDAGAALVSARRVTDIAETAARAGVQAGTAPDAAGAARLDPQQARQAAANFLAGQGLRGDVRADAGRVEVTVRLQQPTTLLRAVGITHLDVSGTGVARPLLGVTEAQR
ncbi:MAG TPA: pilus assembly protein TadG-related protein [Acidimicrobiia bacterium]|nr:pilus assembly protein TadG-related protein [Acidimicrobiia bacterium]